MITIKNESDIKKMEIGGKILAEALSVLEKSLKPGMKTIELDNLFNRFIFKNKAKPAFKNYEAGERGNGFPASICVSINEDVVHGIPGDRVINEGDIVTIDAGVTYEGLITDAAITVPIGEISEEAKRLLQATKEALNKSIKEVKEGARVGDISSVIYENVKKHGFNIFPSLAGHGVGKTLHEDPYIPNVGKKGKGERLEEGMTLAIEVMTSTGSGDLVIHEDGWTLSSADNSLTAQFEHTVLVTKNGYKILTALK